MKLLYLECNMGAAGDMLAAALYELCTAAQKDAFARAMQAFAPHGVRVQPQAVTVCGIAATHMAVTVHGCEEQAGDAQAHAHHHSHADDALHLHTHAHADSQVAAHADCHGHSDSHDHDHGHHDQNQRADHHHATPTHIAALLDSLSLPASVCAAAKSVYARIAQAESRAHGVPVSDIHFHEVGALDAVADVAAVCLLVHLLAPDAVLVSPIATGSGTVRCAHGVLPVPAPATAFLLEGAPTWAGPERGELCTPTGAALLRELAGAFGPMPVMTVQKIGCGAGTKQFATANVVRAFWGTATDTAAPHNAARSAQPPADDALPPNDAVCELACNLDDATAEEIGFAQQQVVDAGALDVYTTPIGMKKSRPGTMLTVLCRPADANRMAALLLTHTPTLGVRRTDHARYALARGTVEVATAYGHIRVKTARGYGAVKVKPEYDDIAAAAARTGVSFGQVRDAALAVFAALDEDQ